MTQIRGSSHKRSNFMFFFLFILVYLLEPAELNEDCKFKIKVGSTYTLRCSSNLTRAANLVLITDTGIIPKAEYKIVDGHTIEYQWKNIPRINTFIECYFHNKANIAQGVIRKTVITETAPEPVTNFKCISYDFKYLKCSFEKCPQYYTTTKVSPSDDIKAKSIKEHYHTFHLSQPKYNPEKQQIYNFTVISKNCFGVRSQSFSLNHLENVIPGKPNVSLANIKPNSAVVRLTMHDKLYMEKGLLYEARLFKILFGIAIKVNTSNLNPKQIQNILQIDNLNAFQRYSLEVKIKSVSTEDKPEMWSQPTIIEFETPPKPPDRPPEVENGGFYIDPEGFLHLYWKMLPENEYNGDNFRYEIQSARKNSEVIRGTRKVKKGSFTTVYNLPKDDYEFWIRSVNDEGASDATLIRVPKIKSDPPRNVRSIFDKNIYQLIWDPPLTQELVQSYTIFTCNSNTSEKGYGEKCSKDFDFYRVSSSVTNVTINKANHFAVAANYINGKSGMVWTECLVSEKTDIGEINSMLVTSINSTSIYLKWFTTCSQKTLVKEYIVKICKPIQLICFNISFSSEKEDTLIRNLDPNTKYDFQISLVSDKSIGKFSVPFEGKTLEGAPLPPSGLQVCGITESSIELKWKRPTELNGQLRYYKVMYNNKWTEISDVNNLIAENVTYNLTNLDSNQVYDISVFAGTILDSEPSNTITIRTEVKEPPIISDIQDEIGFKTINISWTTDTDPSIHVRLYEVKFESLRLNSTKSIFLLNDTSFLFEDQECTNSNENYGFSIRAINFANHIPHGKCYGIFNQPITTQIEIFNKTILRQFSNTTALEYHFFERYEARLIYGKWSAIIPYKCNGSTANFPFKIHLAILLLVIVGLLAVLIQRSIKRIKAAKKIGIRYPSGLHLGNEDSSESRSRAFLDSSTKMDAEGRLISIESVDDGYCTGREGSSGSDISNNSQDNEIEAKTKLKDLPHALQKESERDYETDDELLEFDRLPLNRYLEKQDLEQSAESLSPEYKIQEVEYKDHFPQDIPDIFDSNGYVRKSCLPSLNFPPNLQRQQPVSSICTHDIDSTEGLNSSPLFDSNGYVLKTAINKIVAETSVPNSQVELRSPTPNAFNFPTRTNIFDANGYVLKSAVSKVFRKNDGSLDNQQAVELGSVKRSTAASKPIKPDIFDANGYVLKTFAKEMLGVNPITSPTLDEAGPSNYNSDGSFKTNKFDLNGYVITARHIA